MGGERKTPRLYAALLAAVLAVLMSACSLDPLKDVKVNPADEFRAERARAELEPIILIPGSLGSRLYNVKTGEVAWGNFQAMISDLRDNLDLPMDGPTLADNRDDLRAYRVLDLAEVLNREGSGEVRFYAEIIDFLTTTLGYRAAYGERFYRGHNLFVFFYDWRRSNVEAAQQLAELVANIRRDLGSPTMKFTLLGVSNGGLIARYYLKYGGEDVVSGRSVSDPLPVGNAGAADVRRVICLGTPHMGTLDSLRLLHEGYAPTALARRHPPWAIFSMPASFELLPPPGERVFVGENGETLDFDLWDPEKWEERGLSIFNPREKDSLRHEIANRFNDRRDREALFEVEMAKRRRHLRLCLGHARRFLHAIAGPTAVPCSVICGANAPTLARVGVVRRGERWEFVFEPRVAIRARDPMTRAMFAVGDGVVTRRSALGLALPESSAALARSGGVFRTSLESFTFTPFLHRQMFEDPMLKLALADVLTR